MSVEQYQRIVNGLDKEIADLEKKKASKDKEIASLQGRINLTDKSITKNTSQSMISNKLRQISKWKTDIAKKSKESADLFAKIADKRKKRSDTYLKLQKAQQDEQRRTDKQTAKLLKNYENRINELQRQSMQQIIQPHIIQTDEEYDVFVSHAWEDKADFVDELVSEMRRMNIKVWYDTERLKWGDSMREKIDKGLSKSRYGVVVLSPDYIREDKYWTKAELNGLFQVETINGKTILPIWHKLTKKQVAEYSPIIADRKAMTTALMTPDEIAMELMKLFKLNNGENVDNG